MYQSSGTTLTKPSIIQWSLTAGVIQFGSYREECECVYMKETPDSPLLARFAAVHSSSSSAMQAPQPCGGVGPVQAVLESSIYGIGELASVLLGGAHGPCAAVVTVA